MKLLLLEINDINIKIIKEILVKRLHVQNYERWRKFPKQRWKNFFKALNCGRLQK